MTVRNISKNVKINVTFPLVRAIFVELEMKTREQNRNSKRTEIKRLDCMVYRTDTNARGFCLVKRTPG